MKDDEVLRLSEHWKKREKRARERLSRISEKALYFAILGLKTEAERFEFFGSQARLQVVPEPPDPIEVVRAMCEKGGWEAVARYSLAITYELAVTLDSGLTAQGAVNLAWWIISAIRVRTLAGVLVPVRADHSWSTIAALDGTCHISILEDVPQARHPGHPKTVSLADLEWVESHVRGFAELLEIPKFRLAVDALCSYHLEASSRMMVAKLWSGIEALFSISTELRFRLATLIASILEPRGIARRELFRRMLALYDIRSRAVHGNEMAEAELLDHITEVSEVLSRLICGFTEAGHVPTKSEQEDQVFL